LSIILQGASKKLLEVVIASSGLIVRASNVLFLFHNQRSMRTNILFLYCYTVCLWSWFCGGKSGKTTRV